MAAEKAVRIGAALFNADHLRLGEEVQRTEDAGVDFLHLDVFDGYAVPDQAFAARTIKALRELSRLPIEVHLSANDSARFLPSLADAGVDLVFLPAETTPFLYETIYRVRELGMGAGLCVALGTPLSVVESTVEMVDAILLLGRVTGEGNRGRDFNPLVIERIRRVRQKLDRMGSEIDLQAAGGLETESIVEACRAGAASFPIGAALYRARDMRGYLASLRSQIAAQPSNGSPQPPTRPFNVLVASRSFGKSCPDHLERLSESGCRIIETDWTNGPTEEQLLAAIPEAHALVSGTEPVTRRVVDAAIQLEVIAKHGVGYENIDLGATRDRGIPVTIAGDAIADSVADMTMALLLALARRIPQGSDSVRAGEWKRFVGPELRDKTLGIVGLGKIGKAVAVRARSFGMRIAACDTHEDARFTAAYGVEYMPLEQLLSASDFVTLHAPVTHATRHLIDSERLKQMKPGAFLLNTARGELVDEAALAAALRDGHLAGAASDVFEKEPPGASPLLALDNFIAMPHCGGQTPEGLRRMGEITVENLLRVMRGDEPLYRAA